MTSSDPSLKSFAAATDVAKQLIALATGIVAATVTFSKDLTGGEATKAEAVLIGIAWVAYLLSVLCGVGVLLGISGSYASMEQGEKKDIYDINVRIPGVIQVVCFLTGLIFTIIFGVVSL